MYDPVFIQKCNFVCLAMEVLTKGQLISKQNCRVVTSPKKWTKLIILNIFSTQDSELRSFFWEELLLTILFWDLLTFKWNQNWIFKCPLKAQKYAFYYIDFGAP